MQNTPPNLSESSEKAEAPNGVSRRRLLQMLGIGALATAAAPEALFASERTLKYGPFEPTPVHSSYTQEDFAMLKEIDEWHKENFVRHYIQMLQERNQNNKVLKEAQEVLQKKELNEAGEDLLGRIDVSLNLQFIEEDVNDLAGLYKKVLKLQEAYGLSIGNPTKRYWEDWNDFNFGNGPEGLMTQLTFETSTIHTLSFNKMIFSQMISHLDSVKNGDYKDMIVTINGHQFVFSGAKQEYARQKQERERVEETPALPAALTGMGASIEEVKGQKVIEFPYKIDSGAQLILPHGKSTARNLKLKNGNNGVESKINFPSGEIGHYIFDLGENKLYVFIDGKLAKTWNLTKAR